ncbi:peptide-methionine (S)-S-oxide reductase MsrA [Aureimonas populi]|uniref:Peptide methionine sulfoxide reductase MsrA n=1 Tax=Aureimonas populi TaxID=1701758 RepID=A0ABW5CN30_9HYPH|nr:peptide-methionine (S)-S-oxide reductase MsrA [Aureimonas populi]
MRPAFVAAFAASALLAAAKTAGAAGALAQAVFAGGCFWSVEKRFDEVPGVVGTVSGFSGGSVENPSYRQVIGGGTGHLEAVQVTYDPGRVSYGELLDAYWHSIDPTDASGQFCDKGPQYRTAIFVSDESQRRVAEASAGQAAAELGQPLATEIRSASAFFPAEVEHQDFHVRSPLRYEAYRIGCGRDAALARVWGGRAQPAG